MYHTLLSTSWGLAPGPQLGTKPHRCSSFYAIFKMSQYLQIALLKLPIEPNAQFSQSM